MGGTESTCQSPPVQDCPACMGISKYIDRIFKVTCIADLKKAVETNFGFLFEVPPCNLLVDFNCNCPRANEAIAMLDNEIDSCNKLVDPPLNVQLNGLFLQQAMAIIQLQASNLQELFATSDACVNFIHTLKRIPWSTDQGATVHQEEVADYLRITHQKIHSIYKPTLASHIASPKAVVVKQPDPTAVVVKQPDPTAVVVKQPDPKAVVVKQPDPKAVVVKQPELRDLESGLNSLGRNSPGSVISRVLADQAVSEVAVDIFRLSSQIANSTSNE